MTISVSSSRARTTRTGPSVLVVEDDANLREALCDTLAIAGFSPVAAADGTEALATLRGVDDFGMVVSDVEMAPMNGLELLDSIKSTQPEMPVLLMTAFGNIGQAVDAMRVGAADYLVKPFEAEVLAAKVSRYCRAATPNHAGSAKVVIAVDSKSVALSALACRVARSDVTVMITGESGTGKEVLAQQLHRQSKRIDGPFVALNCAAIPENMLEAILFGYEKGAYTGAHKACPGKFEQAEGGTILLDEISEMPLELQAKLLRVLQEREVERLGAQHPIRLDVRVVATTNRDLIQQVACGRFREDLYYRLNVFPLHVHPLRERPGDVGPLAQFLLARAQTSNGGARALSVDALEKLNSHRWPGNVRELDNVIQRAVVLAPGEIIDAAAITFEFGPTSYDIEASAIETGASRDVPMEHDGGLSRRRQMPAGFDDELSASESLGDELRQSEFRLIADALGACGGSRKAVAERLGISARTLRYKLARMRDAGLEI
jgi:two-component system response regulator FlrC